MSTRPFLQILLIAAIICLTLGTAFGQGVVPATEVGITPHLGNQVPGDIELVDENGNLLQFSSLLNKPTILVMVYFDCPNICGPLLTNLAEIIERMPLTPGTDYQSIAVSFDPEEDSALASRKKANFIRASRKKVPEDAWRFLTGDETNIQKLTNAVGFNFKKQNADFAHPAAFIVLSPGGKISRYIQGIGQPAADVEFALTQAAKGEVGTTRPQGDSSWGPVQDRKQFLSFCFDIDPKTGQYVFNYTRIVGIVVLLGAAVFVAFLTLRSGRKNRGLENDQPSH